MKVGNTPMRKGLLLASHLFLIPQAALAQSLPLSPEVAAFYSTTPRESEMLVRNREGCGWFMPKPDLMVIKTVPDIAQRIADNWQNYSWDGICHNGLALGPGRQFNYDKQGKLTSVSEIWVLNGRTIGLALTSIPSSDTYDESRMQAISWLGTSYSRNVTNAQPLEPKGGRQFPPFAAFDSPDPAKAYRYTLAASIAPVGSWAGAPARVVETHMTEKYRQTGSYFDRLTDYPCPRGCGALWVQKAGPIIRGFDEFEQQHTAEINAVKASLEPMLKPLLALQAVRKARDAMNAAKAEVAAKAKAAQEQTRKGNVAKAANEASAARRAVAMPGLASILADLRRRGIVKPVGATTQKPVTRRKGQ